MGRFLSYSKKKKKKKTFLLTMSSLTNASRSIQKGPPRLVAKCFFFSFFTCLQICPFQRKWDTNLKQRGENHDQSWKKKKKKHDIWSRSAIDTINGYYFATEAMMAPIWPATNRDRNDCVSHFLKKYRNYYYNFYKRRCVSRSWEILKFII